MPIIIDGGRVPTRWAAKRPVSPALDLGHEDCLRVAFINNMPDAALEDTEMQFFELIDAAAGNTAVQVELFSLPNVPRSDHGKEHVGKFYAGTENLWSSQFDGLIMTGTEPRSADLRDEPYWSALGQVLDWAERNTTSTVLSCLAAHAGVLHSDGIRRHPLPDKQFGVFECRKTGDRDHGLTQGTGELVGFPHSRWNEVREDELVSCGYSVLTKSSEAGVDLFVKKKRESLFVHFQGHPEYGAQTLLKEYRRDIKRFLRQERKTYPTMPRGYFDSAATEALNEFQKKALSDCSESMIAVFPESAACEGLTRTWESSAKVVYHNWLQYILSAKAATSRFSAMSASFGGEQKRTAVP